MKLIKLKQTKLPKRIRVKSHHFKTSQGYISNTHCPIAMCVREIIGEDQHISVSPGFICIGTKVYAYDRKQWEGSWDELSESEPIDDMIDRAKKGDHIETKVIDINEINYA